MSFVTETLTKVNEITLFEIANYNHYFSCPVDIHLILWDSLFGIQECVPSYHSLKIPCTIGYVTKYSVDKWTKNDWI